MYPKTTFLKQEMDSAGQALFQDRVYPSKDMAGSHLHLRKEPKRAHQRFEIDLPYLLLYEKFDAKSDRAIYLEFSEVSKVFASNSLRSFQAQGPLLHSHDFYELTFVLSGRLHMQIENEEQFYSPGECCLCNKNIHHAERMDSDVEIFLLLIKEDYIKDALEANYYYDSEGNFHTIGNFFHTLVSQR